jgi:hypothetical protein
MTIPSCDPPEADRPGSDGPGLERPGDGLPGGRVPGGDRRRGGDPAGRASDPGRARRLALHFIVVLLGASVVGLVAGGQRTAASVALGVALAGANVLVMQKITSLMAAPHGDSVSGGGAVWGLLLPFKLLALVGVAYALVARGAEPVPLAMGFALLPLTGVFLPRPSSVEGRIQPRFHSR